MTNLPAPAVSPSATIHPTPRPAQVWLASQSPRRLQLMDQLGVPCALLLPLPDEDPEALETLRPGEPAQAYVQRVTRAKVHAARQRHERLHGPHGPMSLPIVCADTTVVLGQRVLGKPQNARDAHGMLQLLSGRTHRVMTAVAVHDGRRLRSALSISRVRMAPLPRAVIGAYVASGEPMGKAGAYAIQGILAGWISHIEGSHSAIMGLPLFETAQLLRASGVALGPQPQAPSP